MVSCGQSCSFSEEQLLGLSLKGLVCILQKGALSEMDTWLTEHFAFAFLPSQPPVPSFSPLMFYSRAFGYHWGKQCMLGSRVGCCALVGQQSRGGGMAVLQLKAPAASHLSLVLSGLLEFALPVTAAS